MVNIIELNVSGEQLGPNSMECNQDTLDILFHFSDEWDKMIKVAGFSRGDIEFEPQALTHGKKCTIPKEALEGNFSEYLLSEKIQRRCLKQTKSL